MPFRVLFVCTGNICRSPAAELLMRARVSPDADVHVSSAGTHGLVGYGVDGPTEVALRELGIDPSGHQARRLDTRMITAADLVLTATMNQRSIVLQSEPMMMSRVFTLREFARMAQWADQERPAPADHAGPTDQADQANQANRAEPAVRADPLDRVAMIARLRGTHGPAGPRENDIADPFGASVNTARAVVAEIAAAVDFTVAGLDLSAPVGGAQT